MDIREALATPTQEFISSYLVTYFLLGKLVG